MVFEVLATGRSHTFNIAMELTNALEIRMSCTDCQWCSELPQVLWIPARAHQTWDDRQLWGSLRNTFQLASDRFDVAKQTDFWSRFPRSNVFCVSKDFDSQTDLSLDWHRPLCETKTRGLYTPPMHKLLLPLSKHAMSGLEEKKDFQNSLFVFS